MHTLISSVAPIFVIIAIGYVVRRLNVIKTQGVNSLISYVYYVALPALIIHSLMILELNNGSIPQILFWNIVILLLNTVLCLAVVYIFRISNKDRAVFFLASTVGNSLYLGIPLTTSALGLTAGTADYALIVMIGVLYLVGGIFIALVVNEVFFVGHKDFRSIALHLSKNPLIIAIFVGLLLSFIPLPEIASTATIKPLSMIAASASPVALFILGSYLYGHRIKQHLFMMVSAVAWKVVIVPLVALGVLFLADMNNPQYAASILYAGTPTAVTALMIAKVYGFNTRFVSTVIVFSTLLSLVTSSVIIIFLGL